MQSATDGLAQCDCSARSSLNINNDFQLSILMMILWQAFIFIIVIGVLVFVHELGHFLVAKWCGVGVLKFSLGFGKAIYKFTRRETVYQISWIPLGGYVRMVGDMPDPITTNEATDSLVRGEKAPKKADKRDANGIEEMNDLAKAMVNDRSYWFLNQSYLKKVSIVAAGPIFNFLFAIIVFGIMGWIWGQSMPAQGAVIGKVQENSPAYLAGLEPNDKIVSINGQPVSEWLDAVTMIRSSHGQEVNVTVQRGDVVVEIIVSPKKKVLKDIFEQETDTYLIGIEVAIDKKDISFWQIPMCGLERTYFITAMTLKGLWHMITGQLSAKNLAGPIFIFKQAGKEARQGLENILGFMAVLSVSLAILNLLPIPVLDGGHILFFTIEGVIRRELPLSIKEHAQMVGFFLLMMLMAYVIMNDIGNRRQEVTEPGIEWDDE